MPVIGPFYSYAQLMQLWINAGGDPSKAEIAAAIAMAESGGGVGSWNTAGNSAGEDEGLWQINSYYNPSYATFDATANARGAVAISNNGQNWTPWSTFNSGAYLSHLQNGVTPTQGGPTSTDSTTGSSQSSGTAQDAGLFSSVLSGLDTLMENALYHAFFDILKGLIDYIAKPVFWLLELALGFVLCLAALAMLAGQSKIARAANQAVASIPGPIGSLGQASMSMGLTKGLGGNNGARRSLGTLNSARTESVHEPESAPSLQPLPETKEPVSSEKETVTPPPQRTAPAAKRRAPRSATRSSQRHNAPMTRAADEQARIDREKVPSL